MKLKTPDIDELVGSVKAHGILPTHTCFDDALDLLAAIAKDRYGAILNPGIEKDFEFKLCHAICVDPKGKQYAHAFVEDEKNDQVRSMGRVAGHDAIVEYCADRKEYYDHFKVIKVWRYDLLEAYILNRMHENYGPWQLELLKLCKNYKPGLENKRLIRKIK